MAESGRSDPDYSEKIWRNSLSDNTGLPALVGRARTLSGETTPEARAWIAAYVDALIVPLREAQLPISGRRAVALCASVRSVHGALAALGRAQPLADAAYLALKWGMPQRAQGRRIADSVLDGVHRLALRTAGEPESSPWAAIRAEPDPVRRIALGLAAPESVVDRLALSQLVTDAFAELPLPERYALAWVLSPVFSARDRLTSATWELLAEPVARVLAFAEGGEQQVSAHRSRAGHWDYVLATVSALQREGHPQAAEIGNLLYTLFAVECEPCSPDRVVDRLSEWQALFAPQAWREAA